MPVPQNTLTYDLNPPHRPGIDDLQLALKVNDAEFPPDDAEAPTAEEANQQAAQINAAHRTIPVATIAIWFNVGAPIVFQQSSLRSSEPVYTVTDNSPGDTTITWPANTFPPSIFPPVAFLTQDVNATITAVAVPNGVRVRTRVSGTLTDASFVVFVG